MSKLSEQVDEQTKRESEAFIEQIRSGKLLKRTSPNSSPEYPIEKAMNSVISTMSDPAIKKIIEDTYPK